MKARKTVALTLLAAAVTTATLAGCAAHPAQPRAADAAGPTFAPMQARVSTYCHGQSTLQFFVDLRGGNPGAFAQIWIDGLSDSWKPGDQLPSVDDVNFAAPPGLFQSFDLQPGHVAQIEIDGLGGPTTWPDFRTTVSAAAAGCATDPSATSVGPWTPGSQS